jgi:ethanolamine transporter EutH
MNNSVANLIVGMLLGGVSIFIIYIMIVSRRQEREEKNKDKKGGSQ